jgi:hypothetical protein
VIFFVKQDEAERFATDNENAADACFLEKGAFDQRDLFVDAQPGRKKSPDL